MLVGNLKWPNTIYKYHNFIILCAFLVLSDLVSKSLMISFYSQFEDPSSAGAIFVRLNPVPLVAASLGFKSFHWMHVVVLAGLTLYMLKEMIECLANDWFFWGELLAFIGLFSNFSSFLIWKGVPDFIPLELGEKLFYLNMADIYIVAAIFIFLAVEPAENFLKNKVQEREDYNDHLQS